MQRVGSFVFVLAATALLSACDRKGDQVAAPAPVASTPAPVAEKTQTAAPDFGGVTTVSREVEAVGSTQELAVVAALQSAVAQVNGARVASRMHSMRTGLDVSVDGQDASSIRSEAFAQKMKAASQGVVKSFEILSQEKIDKVDEETGARVRASDGGYSYSASSEGQGKASAEASASLRVSGDSAQSSGSRSSSFSHKDSVDTQRGASSYASDSTHRKMSSYWKVRVKVEISQYKAPDEQGRPKIVVALPKTLAAGYAVGDGKVNADEVAQAVRGRLSDILTQTQRFIVLDREFGADMQAEIDHINSGNVRLQDSARLGQQLATDLILIPTIERFEYQKAVRHLRMSDRELVSYSGGGRITLRLLNAATGEVVMSDSFDYTLPSADPSTMPRVIDGKNMAAKMMDALSGQIGGAVVSEIFPVSVVSLTGDQAVLSQGGESLQVGQRWQAVYLGEELKDPQTGRSLGRNEVPLGTIRVERVSTQTSYGVIEEGASALGDKPFKPGAIELRKKLDVSAQIAGSRPLVVQELAPSVTAPTARPTRKTARQTPDAVNPVAATSPPPQPQHDGKW